jgi:hypothetical protein
MQASTLDRLSDNLLQMILDFAMARDSPFYIDDHHLGQYRSTYEDGSPRRVFHDRTLQPIHRTDWITINSTSRRIRTFGKISFFSIKTFAIHKDFPERLKRRNPTNIKGMTLDDQALALSYIRDIIIVNPEQARPTTILTLPKTIAAFPCLRRCTLLYGFTVHDGEYKGAASDVEFITAAFILGRPVPAEMQEYMADIGVSRSFRLDEAMGSRFNLQSHRNLMEANIYPVLRVRAELLQAEKAMQRSAKSEVIPTAVSYVLKCYFLSI